MDTFFGGLTGGFLAIVAIEGVKLAARAVSAIGGAIDSRRRKRAVAEAVASVPADPECDLATFRQVQCLVALGINPRFAARMGRRRASGLISVIMEKD